VRRHYAETYSVVSCARRCRYECPARTFVPTGSRRGDPRSA
jgi:hypothetical protein